MNNDKLESQVDLFKSVFNGREDFFAIRWEKGNKSGYMPACFYDKYLYRIHKIKGGGFQNFAKILHDFTDERKGYIIWKDLLEEIIFRTQLTEYQFIICM